MSTEPRANRIAFTISHFVSTKLTSAVSAHFAKCRRKTSRPFRQFEINLPVLYVEDDTEHCPKSKRDHQVHGR
jgi:hypothetical protein